ncbi:MAG: thiol-disulfide oxidoreductase DCC family protein, partial [Chitinophagaceae bacterium]
MAGKTVLFTISTALTGTLLSLYLMQENPVVLFDGVCNYCNAMVNFAIRNDKKAILKFAPLQSTAGERLREQYKIQPGVDSVIFIEHGKVYTYSD